jgi:hypothetical protein
MDNHPELLVKVDFRIRVKENFQAVHRIFSTNTAGK